MIHQILKFLSIYFVYNMVWCGTKRKKWELNFSVIVCVSCYMLDLYEIQANSILFSQWNDMIWWSASI